MKYTLHFLILISLFLFGCIGTNTNSKTDNYPITNFKVINKFETGFENESEFTKFSVTPQNYLGSTRHELSSENIHSGELAHKAIIYAENNVVERTNTNHRGYPTIQLYKTEQGTFTGKVFTEFWVWLDVPIEQKPNANWFSFATFTSYADDRWARTELANLEKDGIVHLVHVPRQGEKEDDIFQTTETKFPMRKWVKLSILIDYENNNEYNSAYAKVWQDNELVSAARFNPRLDAETIKQYSAGLECLTTWDGENVAQAEELCNLHYTGGLAGMYAPPLIASGTVYNDDLVIMQIE
ncbi:MAG: hypothetical protein COV47_03435 [Candidatus Diapherotrites archaeon CG11_big_fil_rev_8_21_14_0_20_37_9]|nr:MAG: hypothetical protein COV47_03435 [Candidatus Diapherotrites archaeon CG11_big_fil_rev_8_21_14_0_20_37_9]